MVILELIIRIAGITLLLSMAAMILRDAWAERAGRFGFFLAISISAVLATSISAESVAPNTALRTILLPIGSSSGILVWWYCLALLEDDFRLRPFEWIIAAVWSGLGLLNLQASIAQSPLPFEWAAHLRTVIVTSMVGHVIFVALKGRKTDLLETRRQARVLIPIAITTLLMIDILSERIFGYFYTPEWINMMQTAAFLGVILWSFFWLFRLDARKFAFERPAPAVSVEKPTLAPREQVLQAKLVDAMETEKAFLEPDLSISSLAARLGAPEHQLRALINKSMGHRNFRSFLNGYRMAAAKTALTDPDMAATPILTIAMDSGFASLASFNRAFKEETGKTPSAFRMDEIHNSAPPQN